MDTPPPQTIGPVFMCVCVCLCVHHIGSIMSVMLHRQPCLYVSRLDTLLRVMMTILAVKPAVRPHRCRWAWTNNSKKKTGVMNCIPNHTCIIIEVSLGFRTLQQLLIYLSVLDLTHLFSEQGIPRGPRSKLEDHKHIAQNVYIFEQRISLNPPLQDHYPQLVCLGLISNSCATS